MKTMTGIVTSTKNTKTVTVEVTNKWMHPLYKKYVKSTKKFACHIDAVEVADGDMVTIQECRPVSKTKKFVVVSKVGA